MFIMLSFTRMFFYMVSAPDEIFDASRRFLKLHNSASTAARAASPPLPLSTPLRPALPALPALPCLQLSPRGRWVAGSPQIVIAQALWLLRGFKRALGDKAATMIVAEASYEVTAPTINSQLATLKASGADVLFGVVLGKFTSQLIKGIAELGWKQIQI